MERVLVVNLFLVSCIAATILPAPRDMEFDMFGKELDLDKFSKILGENRTELKSLSPKELEKEMERLVARIDDNNDGLLDRTELMAWLRKVEDMNQQREVELMFLKADRDSDGSITFEENWKANEADEAPKNEENMTVAQLIVTSRFNAADVDLSGTLDINEFVPFIYPYRHKHMIDSQISIYDSNNDGIISLKEFLKNFDQNGEEVKGSVEWMVQEKRRFEENFDKNGDGELNRKEVQAWIAYFEGKYKDEETNHLLKQADANKDGFLSVLEVQGAMDTFMDSAITDFGYSIHDEL